MNIEWKGGLDKIGVSFVVVVLQMKLRLKDTKWFPKGHITYYQSSLLIFFTMAHFSRKQQTLQEKGSGSFLSLNYVCLLLVVMSVYE